MRHAKERKKDLSRRHGAGCAAVENGTAEIGFVEAVVENGHFESRSASSRMLLVLDTDGAHCTKASPQGSAEPAANPFWPPVKNWEHTEPGHKGRSWRRRGNALSGGHAD